jgi:hypothetical protein
VCNGDLACLLYIVTTVKRPCRPSYCLSPQVFASNGTLVTSTAHRQGPSATTTWPAYFGTSWSILTTAANGYPGRGVVQVEVPAASRRHTGDHYVGMVQGVTAADGEGYIVLARFKQALASMTPCDRSYGGECASFNAIALTGRITAAVMVRDDPSTRPRGQPHSQRRVVSPSLFLSPLPTLTPPTPQ